MGGIPVCKGALRTENYPLKNLHRIFVSIHLDLNRHFYAISLASIFLTFWKFELPPLDGGITLECAGAHFCASNEVAGTQGNLPKVFSQNSYCNPFLVCNYETGSWLKDKLNIEELKSLNAQ